MSGTMLRTGWLWCVSRVLGLALPTEPLQQLYGAVQGLKYLHDANLTHGDLKGVRIYHRPILLPPPNPLAAKHPHDERRAP